MDVGYKEFAEHFHVAGNSPVCRDTLTIIDRGNAIKLPVTYLLWYKSYGDCLD